MTPLLTLADACTNIVDCEHKTTPIDPNGNYFAVGTPAMRGNKINYNEARRISRETFEAWTRRLKPEVGDLLLAREAPVGPVVRVPDDLRVAPGQRTVLLRPNPALLESRFAYYLLSSPQQQAKLLVKAEGSTVPHLNVADVRSFDLPLLPPMEEQRAIAATLGALDDKIESNRRAIALMEALTRAHFDRLFDIEINDAGVPISTLIAVNPRRRLPAGELATYVGMASLPEFSAEIYEWETKPAGSGQRFMNGDVLMARITPCLENGKTVVVDMLKPDEVAWGSTEYIVLTPQGEVTTPWIYSLVRTEVVRSFAIRSMTGTSGRQRFQADRFDQYKIALPEAAAHKEFNAVAHPMFARMTQLRDENLRVAALRDTLLPHLLSGRIRVSEAAEAVAEVVA